MKIFGPGDGSYLASTIRSPMTDSIIQNAGTTGTSLVYPLTGSIVVEASNDAYSFSFIMPEASRVAAMQYSGTVGGMYAQDAVGRRPAAFEFNAFSKGTYALGHIISQSTAFSVAGGGDTISLLNNLNFVDKFNFVSTAGGAFLEYLEGRELPGISALN